MGRIVLILLCLGLYGCLAPINPHPSLPQKTKDAILKGELHLGMTIDEVKASWPNCAYAFSSPDTSSFSGFGTSTTYQCYTTYFNFYNGKLQSVNQFKY